MGNRALKIIAQVIRQGLVYRLVNILTIIIAIIECSVMLFIWKAVYQGNNVVYGMEYDSLVLYFIVTFSIGESFFWGINNDIAKQIQAGHVTMELLYPMSYMKYYFFYKLGVVIGDVLLIGIPIFVICCLIFQPVITITITSLLLFALVYFLAVCIIFFVEIIFGSLNFVTNSSWGLQVLKKAIIIIFSASLAPIDFFPTIMQNIMRALPFIDVIGNPVNVLIGTIQGKEVLSIICHQVLWIGILGLLATAVFKQLVKKVTILGG